MGRYDDIINHPHHVSTVHPPMAMINRAAQFSPFAALTGYDDAIAETARLTDLKIELTEDERNVISRKLEQVQDGGCVEITHFVADTKKVGGRYVTEKVEVKQVLPAERVIRLKDGRRIGMDDVLEVE